MTVMVLLLAWYAAGELVRKNRPGGFDYDRLGRLPVVSDGRLKPFDTAARNNLLLISGRSKIRHNKQKLSATRWLAELMFGQGEIDAWPVFLIDDTAILGGHDHVLGRRDRFSWEQLQPQIDTVRQQAAVARQVPVQHRSRYQVQVMELDNRLDRYVQLAGWEELRLISPTSNQDGWLTFRQALARSSFQDGSSDGVLERWLQIAQAYRDGDSEVFNRHVTALHDRMNELMPESLDKVDFEASFNTISPFGKSITIYFAAFGLACLSLVTRLKFLRRYYLLLLIAGLVLSTFGLAGRVYIQNRPPVTNLYSSVIFVGWFCVLLGVILDGRYRDRISGITASAIGLVSMIIAWYMALDGDTIEMMQAVLDSNFWLTTHVLTIAMGYAAGFLAGGLSVVFIIRYITSPDFADRDNSELAGLILGVTCFSLYFTFLGTMLGGIWADQAWGRFWGWDPKENGAALIILWQLIILHAWWSGLIRGRGLAVLNVGGNIVIAWSWFGVNMLGIGMHSYGFMNAAAFWLVLFIFSQLLVMTVGLMPAGCLNSLIRRRSVENAYNGR